MFSDEGGILQYVQLI